MDTNGDHNDVGSSSDEDYIPGTPPPENGNDSDGDSVVNEVVRRRQTLPLPPSPFEICADELDDSSGFSSYDRVPPNEGVNGAGNNEEEDDEDSLPSVGGSFSGVASRNSGSSNNGKGRSESDEESLPSVGGSDDDVSRSLGSEMAVNEPYAEMDDESLPSVGGEEIDGSDRSLQSFGDAGDQEEEEDEDDVMGEQENAAQLAQAFAGCSCSAPVGGFRVRVDSGGEEHVEFASENDDEEDSDTEWQARLGGQPVVEFALPENIVASVANRVNIRRQLASVAQDAARDQIVIQSIRPINIDLTGNSPGDPLTPAQQLHLEHVARMRRAAGLRVRRRRPARRRKKKAPKKKKPKLPPRPPKPLGPLYINENWNGNENFKEYSKIVSKMKACRVHINWKQRCDSQSASNKPQSAAEDNLPGPSSAIKQVTTSSVDEDGESQHPQNKEAIEAVPEGYKVGEVKFDRCGMQKWPWTNKTELQESFEDIQDLILYVSDQPSGSILHLKVFRTVQGEKISERKGPPPKLSKRDSQREIIYNVTQHYFYHVDPVGVPADLFNIRALGNRKTFLIDFNNFEMENQQFTFDIVLLESAILGDHDVHSIPVNKSLAMQDVFTNFLGVAPPPVPLEESRQKEDIEWFYGQIKKYHKQEKLPTPDLPIQPPNLKPTLRDYQRDAVHWMLYREGGLDHCEAHSSQEYLSRVDLVDSFLEKMYIPIKLTKHNDKSGAGSTVDAFYNPFTTYVCWKVPTVPPLPKGGILCDEMGLGKTVETLSLILLNTKPVADEFKDYFYGETTSFKDLKKEEEKMEQDSSASSEEEEESPSDSENSDSGSSSEDSIVGRKRKKRGRGRKKKKPKKKVISTKGIATSRIFRRGRRAASPCEFSTTMDTSSQDMEEKEDVNEDSDAKPARRPARKSAQQARLTTKAALEEIEKSMKTKKSKRGKKGSKEETKASSPVKPKLYDAMKVLYDSALSEYRFADEAKVEPKFHGKFYDTDIEMREFFECICGETYDGLYGGAIVKCTICGSSQHAECVGFDEKLQSIFMRMKRTYLCPHCEAMEVPTETKSTLIITPPSISHQWIKEIQRHVQDHKLNILFYKGVSYHGYMPPTRMARYDLVITTYNVLSAELDFVDLPHCNSADGRRFRNPKRFLSTPSPLPSIFWWRVVLDEAQMVEGIGTKMSIMATKIQATHRWCVTGTPVNKGLQDLFGLFVFLKAYPISYDIWWTSLVKDAFFRKETDLLYQLFGQLMWRNGKQDVLDQLGIPPQTEVVHWLNFSAVETHFYKQQFEICSNRILDKIRKLQRISPDVDILQTRLSSLDRFTLHGLLAPFLELRQACCHPQMVKGQLISLQKGTLTMEQLLEKLIKKTQLQCIDDHRKVVGALNGMAGIHIIRKLWIEAAEKYREVLQSAEKHKEHFQTDSLQLLHTMVNLAEILDGNHAGVAFTLRDGSLRTEAAELRTKYMKKYADAIRAAHETAEQHTKTIDDLFSQYKNVSGSTWWVAALRLAQKVQKIDGLIQSLKQDLQDVTKKNQKNVNTIAKRFHDGYGLENVLIPSIMEMESLRNSVLDGLEELRDNDPSLFVDSAIRCHLRQQSNSYYNDSKHDGDTKCKLCQYHDNFLLYESVIFKIDNKDKIIRTGRNWQQRKLMADYGELADELTDQTKSELLAQEAEDLKATTEHVQLINEELRRGHWGDSETEVVLKGIHRFARVNCSGEISQNGGIHLKILEAFKKEFRYLRILWRQIFDQVSGLDELSQATTRLLAIECLSSQAPSTSAKVKQLSSGFKEKALKTQNLNIIAMHETELKMSEFRSEYVTGQETLSLHLGQLLYLKTLKKNDYGKRGTLNTEDCPICAQQLGKEWSVLRCGHSYCCECVKKMCPSTFQSFQCPLCRHSMKFADVSFVDTSEFEPEMGPGNSAGQVEQVRKEVKGSHSTKVEAIVEKLLQLQDSHPGEKCIIFSTWNDILSVVARALTQNDIKYCLLNQPGKPFHANLEKFREREDLQVLLMPLTSGAKGLNIIEATHVILVEPILNLASELQAIGRVHRMGQTKPTFVHRFYVKRTIEEKLFQILKVQDVSSDEEGSLTVKDLQNLISLTMST